MGIMCNSTDEKNLSFFGKHLQFFLFYAIIKLILNIVRREGMALSWSSDLETGNPIIDSEHQELIKKVNDFYFACSQGKAVDEVLNMLRFLKLYTDKHFAHEEKLQQDSNYPEFNNHRMLHRVFQDRVDELEIKIRKEGISIGSVVEINQKVGYWLMEHIKKEDVKLAKYLAEVGQ